MKVAYFETLPLEDESNRHAGGCLRPTELSPNYDFFVPDLVCWEHKRPKVKWWANYEERFTTEDPEAQLGFTCTECGKLDPVSFKMCPHCRGAFYDLFRHPHQTKGYHWCWNCLEADEPVEMNPWYMKYTKLPPPKHLQPPVVTPEMLAEMRRIQDEQLKEVLDKPVFSFGSFDVKIRGKSV